MECGKLWRIYDVGFIDRRTFESTNKEYEKAYLEYKKSLKIKQNDFIPPKGFYQKNVVKANSFGFVADAFNAYRNNAIGYYEIASLLNVNNKHMSTIESIVFNGK